jgi:hypothetical protein
MGTRRVFPLLPGQRHSTNAHSRPERDGRETPKQSFDFKKRAFDSLSIPGAYLSLATYLHARITSMSERLPVRMSACAVHVSQRCSVYDGRTVLMSRRFDRRASAIDGT